MKNRDEHETCRQALLLQIKLAGTSIRHVKVPAPQGLMLARKGSHYHFQPEVFIQLGGYTDFECPKEVFRLWAGEIAVLPVGVPHRETARPWHGKPFLNMVIMMSPSDLSWHLATEGESGFPRGGRGHLLPSRDAARLAGYLGDLADAYHSHGAFRDITVRGLLLAFLSSLLAAVEGAHSAPRSRESVRVTECRDYVLRHLADPGLNVKAVARRIRCSPNYLSSLFCRETGGTLTSFIQRERIVQARHLLEDPAFNVKETARAVGYEDPAYFARVFRRHTGKPPKKYQGGFPGM